MAYWYCGAVRRGRVGRLRVSSTRANSPSGF